MVTVTSSTSRVAPLVKTVVQSDPRVKSEEAKAQVNMVDQEIGHVHPVTTITSRIARSVVAAVTRKAER